MEAKKENRVVFAVTGQDCFNYLAKYGTSDIQIQAVVRFDGFLDEKLLEKALHCVAVAQPILQCRFVEDDKKAYWEMAQDNTAWCELPLERCSEPEEAICRFLAKELDNEERQVFTRLIRAEKGDTLCLKLNHSCADGAGLKELLLLLAESYSKLSKEPDWIPERKNGRRDQQHYFDAMGIENPMALFDPQRPAPPPTWAFPYHEIKNEKKGFSFRRICGEAFEGMKRTCRREGVTINTLILSAFYESLFEMNCPPACEEMEIYVTQWMRGWRWTCAIFLPSCLQGWEEYLGKNLGNW